LWIHDNDDNSDSFSLLLQIYGPNSEMAQCMNSNVKLDTNTWYNLTGVFDKGNKSFLYLDGVEIASTTDGNNISPLTSTDELTIGSAITYATYLRGGVKDITIYNTALTSSQVSEVYNSYPESLTNKFNLQHYSVTSGASYSSYNYTDSNSNPKFKSEIWDSGINPYSPTGKSTIYSLYNTNIYHNTLGSDNIYDSGKDQYVGTRAWGYIKIPTTGSYEFSVKTDDGSRLWINSNILQNAQIESWKLQGRTTYDTSSINLIAGHYYHFRYDNYEWAGGHSMELYWTPPGGSEELIPSSNIFYH
jgi:hypothetical protein